jgi:hypothetical protein
MKLFELHIELMHIHIKNLFLRVIHVDLILTIAHV